MSLEGSRLIVTTRLMLGVQFDEFDYRLFLRNYHANLRSRFPEDSFPAYSPRVVLDSLIFRYETGGNRAGGVRAEALTRYAHRAHRLDLGLTGSDYGPFEKRHSPYDFERLVYHLGHCLASAQVQMEFPGFNPYKSTRRLHIPFVREHIDSLVDLLPDYLWWELHDQTDMLRNILAPEQMYEVRKRIERAGFKLDDFGLYMTTMETLAEG